VGLWRERWTFIIEKITYTPCALIYMITKRKASNKAIVIMLHIFSVSNLIPRPSPNRRRGIDRPVLATLFAFIIFAILFGFSSAAQAQQMCCIKTETFEDPITRQIKLSDEEPTCRLDDPSQGTQPCAGDTFRFDRARGGQKVESSEVSKACTEYPNPCRQIFEATLANCPSKSTSPTASDTDKCDKTPSCQAFNSKCYSVYDKNVCPEIRDSTICGKFQACKWENNSCVTLLQSAISSQYDLSKEGRGAFLEPCAITGSCRNTNDILKLLLNIVDYAMKLIGVLAFVMFIAGGAIMITSFGNPEQFKKGQQMLLYAIIGIIVSVSAVLIVKFVLDAIGVERAFRAF